MATTPSNAKDTELYGLLEQIVRTARGATRYDLSLAGDRPDSSTFNYHQDTPDRSLIPWGVIDGIRRVNWYPHGSVPRGAGYDRLPEGIHAEVYADYWDHGIAVVAFVMGEHHHFTVGIEGVVRAMGHDKELHAFASNEEVVAKVLELIEQVYLDYSAERRMESKWVDYDDGESRHDPLDERNHPLHER